ncbi:protein containing DUF132 [Candidatus Magnetobacterium bavaricum]|uniref:Protein containing DUF132 n=1 Tax=Candidatus Magnetobacterium bavaricum TaxID=29290 RepID=A0A0F3GUC7_9BACT|nr:protein containing DUF132 [Candidatus Magnetobacterium bavaricum]
MTKVVLDTNVFVSAIITPQGKSARILRLVWEGKIQMVTSADIMSEIRDVLLYSKIRKYHLRTPEQIETYLEDVVGFSEVTCGQLKIDAVKSDPADNKIIECALEGNVDFIISGDRHLLNLINYQGIKIVAPSTFLESITD